MRTKELHSTYDNIKRTVTNGLDFVPVRDRYQFEDPFGGALALRYHLGAMTAITNSRLYGIFDSKTLFQLNAMEIATRQAVEEGYQGCPQDADDSTRVVNYFWNRVMNPPRDPRRELMDELADILEAYS